MIHPVHGQTLAFRFTPPYMKIRCLLQFVTRQQSDTYRTHTHTHTHTHTLSSCGLKTLILLKQRNILAPNKGRGERNMKKQVFYLKQVRYVRKQRGLDPAQRVPHGHGLPQSGQHLVPVGDPHPAGLWADDHMTQVLAPAIVRGLCHRHPQGQFLQTV